MGQIADQAAKEMEALNYWCDAEVIILACDHLEVMNVEFRMDGDGSFFVFHDTICNLRWFIGNIIDFDLVLSDLSDIRQVQK